MMFPKISVITPSYNQGHFLEETILSVIGQNYPNLEYIIIDGGSSDNTVSIITKYAHHLAYWVSEKDNGQAEAINKGFKKATGEIFCWLNSDDLFMPGALFTMAQKMSQNSNAIYFGNCIHFKKVNNGIETMGSNVVEAANNYSLHHVDFVIQPSSCWSKVTWNKVGNLSEKLHFGLDWEWYLRAINAGIPFIGIPDCLSMYRIHPDHKSGSGEKKRQNEFTKIYEQFAPDMAGLYQMISEEKISDHDIRLLLLKIYLRISGRPFSNEIVLKTLKPIKYRKFSKKAIQECSLML